MNDVELKYDGLLEIPEDEIEDHKKVFISKEVEGKTYFPFKYIELSKIDKCYGMLDKSDYITVYG